MGGIKAFKRLPKLSSRSGKDFFEYDTQDVDTIVIGDFQLERQHNWKANWEAKLPCWLGEYNVIDGVKLFAETLPEATSTTTIPPSQRRGWLGCPLQLVVVAERMGTCETARSIERW